MTEQRRPETSVRPGFARDDWNARYAQKELLWTAAPNRRFAEEVAGLAPGRALDLACGEGRNAVWLAERGWEVTGVDFSDVALAKAAQLATSRGVEVEWVVADVLEYEPEPRAFDLVAVLYLQLPREAMLRAACGSRGRNAVAPGGTLVVLGHDIDEHRRRARRAEGCVGALHRRGSRAGAPRPRGRARGGDRAHGCARPGGEAVAIDALVRRVAGRAEALERGKTRPPGDTNASTPDAGGAMHRDGQKDDGVGESVTRVARGALVVACAVSTGIHGALAPAHLREEPAAGIGFLLDRSPRRAVRRADAPAGEPGRGGAAGALLAGLIVAYGFAVTTGVPVLHPGVEPADRLGLVTKAVELVGARRRALPRGVARAARPAARTPPTERNHQMTEVRSHKPIPLGLTALVALAAALAALAVSGGHGAQAHGPASTHAAVTSASSGSARTCEASGRTTCPGRGSPSSASPRARPTPKATVARLLRNKSDIGNAIVPFYGRAAEPHSRGSCAQHILVAADLIAAAKAGDKAKLAKEQVGVAAETRTRSPPSSTRRIREPGSVAR